MRVTKLDNQPYDRGLIAIYDDFAPSYDGKWFYNYANTIDYSEESFRWHISMAQEAVDDIVYTMMEH